MNKRQQPNLFTYLDYRNFLVDFIGYKKQMHAKYSYRYFSEKSGFDSTNFISLVVKGKRNLTNASVGKIAKGLKLNKQERAYFEDLVFMNQARSHDEKDYYYQRMMKSKPFQKVRALCRQSYDYFSKWYYPAVRELVEMVNQPPDPEAIARLIEPPITSKQAESAVEQLLDLGLIARDAETGRISKCDAALTTGAEVQSLQIANFHKTMLELTRQSMDRFTENERDISSVVLTIDSSRFVQLKERIDGFRKELLELAQNEPKPDQVTVVQIGAFPISKPIQEK